jgi:hypothetical protein
MISLIRAKANYTVPSEAFQLSDVEDALVYRRGGYFAAAYRGGECISILTSIVDISYILFTIRLQMKRTIYVFPYGVHILQRCIVLEYISPLISQLHE